MTRPSPEEWKPLFLNALREHGKVTAACKAVGVGRTTAYDHRTADPAFAAAWDEVEQVELDDLENSTLRRAIHGWLEPVYYRGKRCGVVRKFDHRLAEFFLSRRRREKFSDKALQTSIDQFAAALRTFSAHVRQQDTAEGDESVGPDAGQPDAPLAPHADASGAPPAPDVEGSPPSGGGGPP